MHKSSFSIYGALSQGQLKESEFGLIFSTSFLESQLSRM